MPPQRAPRMTAQHKSQQTKAFEKVFWVALCAEIAGSFLTNTFMEEPLLWWRLLWFFVFLVVVLQASALS